MCVPVGVSMHMNINVYAVVSFCQLSALAKTRQKWLRLPFAAAAPSRSKVHLASATAGIPAFRGFDARLPLT